MLAKQISKAANDAGVHLSTFLEVCKLDKSTFYKWAGGSACTEKSKKKMELLLLHLEQMKQVKQSLEEKNAHSL